MNYYIADNTIQFQFKADLKERVGSLGYKYITEAIIDLYKKTKSTTKTGQLIGMSYAAINYRLRQFGVKLNKRGGKNHVKQRMQSNEHIRQNRQPDMS